jgi:hypothetical protein
MNHRLLWLGLSLIVGVSGGAPRVFAQEVVQSPRPYGWYGDAPLTGWRALYPRTVANVAHAYEMTPMPAPPATSPLSSFARSVQAHLHTSGRDCQSQPFGNCGNTHDQMRFIFGSCRAFFGEGCVPNPPHGTARTYLGGSAAAGGANCPNCAPR